MRSTYVEFRDAELASHPATALIGYALDVQREEGCRAALPLLAEVYGPLIFDRCDGCSILDYQTMGRAAAWAMNCHLRHGEHALAEELLLRVDSVPAPFGPCSPPWVCR